MSFQVIVADPPWSFGDSLPGKSRGAVKNYQCMSLQDIKDFAVPPTEPDALLFMWRVSSMQEEALQVVRAWGFKPHSELVWDKLTVTGKPFFGMGRIVRGSHESCIIATKGRTPKVLDRSIRSRFEAAVGRHSQKPDAFYALVERLSPGPFCELFARKHRPNWTCFGNELSSD